MELRRQFLLRPDLVYLNHGSFGACPRPVFEVYQAWQRELERHPVAFLSRERRLPGLLREARRQLAAYLGAAADDLVFVTNATTGLNVVARSLPLQPDDEVLATDQEYGALDRTWRFICRKRRARYIRRPLPLPVRSAAEVIEAIWAGVTERTRVLFLSHITSPTAIILPVAELIARARGRGIWTVIDGAHAPGQIPVNCQQLGADFYVGNCHKWLLSPKGAAFLFARRAAQRLLEPLVVSWGYQSDVPGPSRFIDEQEYTGTRDVAAFLAVPSAIRFQREHDWERVRRDCQQLVRRARAGIGALTGLVPLPPDDPGWFQQMASFPLPSCDEAVLQRRLREQFGVEIPVIRWGGGSYLRISVQGYNTAAGVDRLLAALAEILPAEGTTPEVERA